MTIDTIKTICFLIYLFSVLGAPFIYLSAKAAWYVDRFRDKRLQDSDARKYAIWVSLIPILNTVALISGIDGWVKLGRLIRKKEDQVKHLSAFAYNNDIAIDIYEAQEVIKIYKQIRKIEYP